MRFIRFVLSLIIFIVGYLEQLFLEIKSVLSNIIISSMLLILIKYALILRLPVSKLSNFATCILSNIFYIFYRISFDEVTPMANRQIKPEVKKPSRINITVAFNLFFFNPFHCFGITSPVINANKTIERQSSILVSKIKNFPWSCKNQYR